MGKVKSSQGWLTTMGILGFVGYCARKGSIQSAKAEGKVTEGIASDYFIGIK